MRAKKLLATLMATTMIFGTAMSVYAAEITTPDESGAFTSTVEGDSTIATPTIKITVPTDVSLTIDPYKINEKGQIVSEDKFIKNESNVPVSVGMGLYATKKTEECDITLATAALKGTETTKSVFAYADLVSSDDGQSATHTGTFDSKSVSQFALAYGTAEKHTTKANMITLAKGSENATFAAYNFQGAVTTKNAKAWTDKDVLTVTVVFTFTPVLAE